MVWPLGSSVIEICRIRAGLLTSMTWTAEGQGSGAVAVLRPAVIYEFEGELVKLTRFFLDQERAREAFG